MNLRIVAGDNFAAYRHSPSNARCSALSPPGIAPRGKRVSRVARALLALLAVPLLVIAGTPKPPTSLCIEGDPNCRLGIKFHPGHYVEVPMYAHDARTQAERFAFYATLADEPSVQGVLLQARGWSQFEGAKDDYSPGYALLDAEIAKLSSYGKRLILSINLSYFTASTTRPDSWPSYLNAPEYGGGPVRFGAGWIARMWEPAIDLLGRRALQLEQFVGAVVALEEIPGPF